jgi:hypothetical protein
MRSRIALAVVLSLTTLPAQADVTTVGWWRLGEADPGAVAGAQAQNPTVASTGALPLIWDSQTNGSAFYRADTAPGPRLRLGASSLSIEIDDTQAYPGYRSPDVPSAAISNVGLEIWAKSNETIVDGTDPSDIVIWNGQENGWGYGIVQQTGTWVAALWPPAGSPFTVIATAPRVTGAWTHLALVESGGTWRFYVNSEEVGSLAATARVPDFGFVIGESYNSLHKGFDGLLDEPRIFTFSPGAFEITDLNYQPLPPILNRSKPSRISLKAGTRVTVTGANLLSAQTVTLAKRPVKGLVRINDATLRFRVPKGVKPSLKKALLTVVGEEGTASMYLKPKRGE